MRKTKWLAMILMIIAVAIGGCSSVSKEDYDSVCKERDELKSENENAKKVLELNKNALQCKAKIEAEYEHSVFVLYVVERLSGIDVSEHEKSISELKDASITGLNVMIELYDSVDSVTEISDEVYDSAIETIKEVDGNWEKTYETVMNLEENIKKN